MVSATISIHSKLEMKTLVRNEVKTATDRYVFRFFLLLGWKRLASFAVQGSCAAKKAQLRLALYIYAVIWTMNC